MKLKEEEKEKLKKDIQNSDADRQKREFMDREQKKESESSAGKKGEESNKWKDQSEDLSEENKNQ
ncbi:hypothetical protein E0K83_11070 [Gramella sp. BOM4]|nr:hypothetical protein [Christiangramia bathymodioli]